MSRFIRRLSRSWAVLPVLCALLLVSNVFSVLPSGFGSAQPAAAGALTGPVHSGSMAPTGVATAKPSDKDFKLTPAQIKTRDANMASYQALKAPAPGKVGPPAFSKNPGPQTVAGKDNASGLYTSSNVTIPAAALCSGCGMSTVLEPRVATAGRSSFVTFNWGAGATTNNGTSWFSDNPYTLFGSGFCCDQDVVYVPSRDRFYWMTLFYAGNGSSSNRIVIANSASNNLSSWCYYTWYPQSLGGASGDTQDFPKLSFSTNNLYLSYNNYNSSGSWYQTTVARFNLDQQANCLSTGYSYLTRTDVFSSSLSNGSADNFYWVSNWFISGGTSGSQLDIFYWPDSSGSYYGFQKNINAYTFGNTSADCGWCGRIDPRYMGVWIGRGDWYGYTDDVLGVAISAGPSNFTTYNYVVYEYFALHSLTYEGNAQTYSTGTHFAYPSTAPNAHGGVGVEMVYGNTNPGNFYVVQDDYATAQPWNYTYWLGGSGTSSSWGDYTGIQPDYPNGDNWVASGWIINGSGNVEYHKAVFGRGRDVPDWSRWNTK